MDIAVIGAAGSCGRQLAVQLLDRKLLHPGASLQLVGHSGGRSSSELWGLRADLEDAFVDDAPTIEVVFDAADVKADLVVMLAGRTIATDPNASADRTQLGAANHQMFCEYADAMASRRGHEPIVIVQSNPVELGVQVFAQRLGRHRVLGAGAWSDTLRLRAEIATDLQVGRPQVHGWALGQHGDYVVPLWSRLQVRGCSAAKLHHYINAVCSGRTLADLPEEIAASKANMLEVVRAGDVAEAYRQVQALPADLRAMVKPFFTHFTAGHTTEITTAHSVVDIIASLVDGEQRALPAQVALEGEWLGIEGVVAAPVVLSPRGWDSVYSLRLAESEVAALHAAAATVRRLAEGMD
ncbi:MAG: malate dehydrogenase [Pseudomonadota bacterium]